MTGPNSTSAQTRFDARIPPSQQPHPHRSQHPLSKGVLASPSHKDHPRNIPPMDERPVSRKGKSVLFTAPTYYEHSANGETDDGYGDDNEGEALQGEQTFEDEEEEYYEEGAGQRQQSQRIAANQQVIDDGAEAGDEDDDQLDAGEQSMQQSTLGSQWRAQQDDHRPLSPRQQASLFEQKQGALSPAQTDTLPDQRTRTQHDEYQSKLQRKHEQQQLLQQEHQQRTVSAGAGQYASHQQPRDQLALSGQDTNLTLRIFDGDAPTKKVSASPPIVRDPNFDINNPFADYLAVYLGRPRLLEFEGSKWWMSMIQGIGN